MLLSLGVVTVQIQNLVVLLLLNCLLLLQQVLQQSIVFFEVVNLQLEFDIFGGNQVDCPDEVGFLGRSLVCHNAFQRLFVDLQVNAQILDFLSGQEQLAFQVVDFLQRLDQLAIRFSALVLQRNQFLLKGGNVRDLLSYLLLVLAFSLFEGSLIFRGCMGGGASTEHA